MIRLFVSASILVVSSLLFVAFSSSRSLSIHLIQENGRPLAVGKQEVRERVWREPSTHKLFDVDSTTTDLFGPFIARIGSQGTLYLVDLGDLKIKAFDSRGQLVQIFGEGKGQGPNEFGWITDIDITDSGELWVADQVNGRVAVYASDGSLQEHIVLDQAPYRLSVFESGQFILMDILQASGMFSVWQGDGAKVTTFGRLVDGTAGESLALDGSMVRAGASGIVFAPRYAGLLMKFARDGSREFAVETIEPLPVPRLRKDGERIWVDFAAPLSTISLSAVGQEIFALSVIESGFKKLGVLDVYDLGTGSYKFSQRVPEPCSRVFVSEDRVVTIKDASVSVWQRES